MASAKVPVLEVNPVNENDVAMTMVPVEDIDDFLEDIAEDYDLGFAELGALRGKAHGRTKAGIKVKGSVKLAMPKISPKAVLSASKLVAKARAAIKAGFKLPPATLHAALRAVPVARMLKSSVKAIAKKPHIKVHVKGRPITVKANLKLPSVKAKVVASAAKHVAGKLSHAIATKHGAKNKHKIAKALHAKQPVKVAVSRGKFPRVPLNIHAVQHKAKAKHTAAQVAALAPHMAQIQKGSKKALARAVSGHAPRPKHAAKPVAICIQAFRVADVSPCIIAQKKPAQAALASNHPGTLQARYRDKAAHKPMGKKRFRAVVHGLLESVENSGNVTPDMKKRIQRIRRVTGVANAN